LLGKKFEKPEEVVRHLLAVQDQEYVGGLWSIALRMDKPIQNEVEKAIESKKIIRTWPMRGTLHLVPSEDIYWLLEYLTPRIVKKYSSMFKKQGLTDEVFKKAAQLVKRALKGNNLLTREEIYEIWEKEGIPTKNSAGLNTLAVLSQQQLICHATRKGKQQTFALLEEWVPNKIMLNKEEALARLALKYFTSHGPATIKDLVFWAGLQVKEAEEGLSYVKSKLEEIELDGYTYYMAKGSKAGSIPSPLVYLLQPFDELTISHRNYEATIEESYIKKLRSLNYFNILLIDGKVCGSWRKVTKKDDVEFEITGFRKFTGEEEKEIEEAKEEYRRFVVDENDLV